MTHLPPHLHDDTYEGNIVCTHRDLSCCVECVNKHEEIVEVFGLHFWVADKTERQSLVKIGA